MLVFSLVETGKVVMGMKEGILGGGTRKTKAWEVRILAIQQAHLADVWEGRSKL